MAVRQHRRRLQDDAGDHRVGCRIETHHLGRAWRNRLADDLAIVAGPNAPTAVGRHPVNGDEPLLGGSIGGPAHRRIRERDQLAIPQLCERRLPVLLRVTREADEDTSVGPHRDSGGAWPVEFSDDLEGAVRSRIARHIPRDRGLGIAEVSVAPAKPAKTSRERCEAALAKARLKPDEIKANFLKPFGKKAKGH
jgi:hypothetical protein